MVIFTITMEISGRKRTSNTMSDCETKKRNQRIVLADCNQNDVIATAEDMKKFFQLLEDKVIATFLIRDTCYKLVDNYLLAMVFVYFQRAKILKKNYSKLSFFVALYLAHDMEEDEEDVKFEIFPWILGRNWQLKYNKFLLLRDKLWKSMDHRALVFSIEPNHPHWKRERFLHHGGCCRNQSDDTPRRSPETPLMCKQCIAQHLYSVSSVCKSLSYQPSIDKENLPNIDNEESKTALVKDKKRVYRYISWSVED